MKRKVYIFNGASRAAAYGIGTYIKQLTDCLRNTDIEFEVVYLHSQNSGNEVAITEESGYKQLSIPSVTSTVERSAQYYQRNIAYLLKEFIPDDKNTQYIFHLNMVLNELDNKILKWDVRYIKDCSLEKGLDGLAHYVISRCSTKPNRQLPDTYIQDLITAYQTNAPDGTSKDKIIADLTAILHQDS